MRTNRNCLLIALLAISVAPAACAQTVFGPQGGDWELTLGGGGSNDKDFNAGSFALNGSVGYYFTTQMELSVRQGVSYSHFGESAWDGSTRLAFDYNFDLNRFRPYLGVDFGGIYGDSVRDTFAAGLEAGLKYYVLPKTFVFGSIEYEWLFRNAGHIDNGFKNGEFIYGVGIGFNF